MLLSPRLNNSAVGEWPPPGESTPGQLIDGAVAPNGLIAAGFGEGGGGRGVVLIINSKTMMTMSEIELHDEPRELTLQSGPAGTYLTLSYAGGGVDVWLLL